MAHELCAFCVLQPFQPVVWFARWLFGRLAWLAIETHVYHVLFPDWIQAQDEGTVKCYLIVTIPIRLSLVYFVAHFVICIDRISLYNFNMLDRLVCFSFIYFLNITF